MTGPGAAAVLDGYLATFAANLPAPRRARNRIVAEIRDGLVSTVDAHLRRGLAGGEAARAAVAEFGDARWLAAQFAAQLTPVTAHRLGRALLATGPAVGLLWAYAYGARLPTWPARIDAVLSAVGYLPAVLAVVVPAAVVAAGGAGALARRLPAAAGLAWRAAVVAGCGCLAADTGLLATALAGVLAGAHPATATGGLLAAAAGVSAVRAGFAAVATRRVLRLQAVAR